MFGPDIEKKFLNVLNIEQRVEQYEELKQVRLYLLWENFQPLLIQNFKYNEGDWEKIKMKQIKEIQIKNVLVNSTSD